MITIEFTKHEREALVNLLLKTPLFTLVEKGSISIEEIPDLVSVYKKLKGK